MAKLTLKEILREIKVKGNKDYYELLLKDHNIQFIINHIIKKYKYNRQEIRSECELLILETVQDYKYNEDFNFVYFLNYIYKYLPTKVYRFAKKLDQIPWGDVSNIEDFNDEFNIDIINLRVALDSLKAGDKELIESIYFIGMTESEIAEEKGITRQAVNNRRRKIIKKLRKIMQ